MNAGCDSAAMRRWVSLSLAGALCWLGGCATVGIAVTGQDKQTQAAMQSETSATTSVTDGKHRVVVSFNDETGNDSTVIYGPTSRKILAGASLMGWSYSEDHGKTWTYGGKLAPPAKWPVLWGDPAMTTSGKNSSIVFMSNLAMPEEKFPADGIDGSVIIGSKGSFIGGACIARSTDGGKTFAHFGCLRNTDPSIQDLEAIHGHFYDGGSMASPPSGELFAAYTDITTSQIDVWRAPDHNSPFVRIAAPFPDFVLVSHPRLRVSSDGSLYVAGLVAVGVDVDEDGDTDTTAFLVYLNRFHGGKWGVPTLASNFTVAHPVVNLGATVQGSALELRTGPQFSFDVGASSEGGGDAIRMLYTRRDNQTQRLFLEGSACRADLSHCGPVPGWTVGSGSAEGPRLDVFNPAVVAWDGSSSVPPFWTSSFYERFGKSVSDVNVSRMYLGYVNGTALGFPVTIAKDITVCSDTRGYWGDYDDMVLVDFKGTTPVFVRFASTDLGKGCTRRWDFASEHLHVQAIRE